MVEPPGPDGRVYRHRRRVRLADVRPSGRLRLDGVARYLQDIAADDVSDAGLTGEVAWVVRRTAVEIALQPRYDQVVDVATWCSGAGAAWAERRTSIDVGGRSAIQAASIWVSLDPVTMRPVPPGDRFLASYGPAAAGRHVRTRLTVPPPGAGDLGSSRPWPLRSADVDLLGHVNNAVAWCALEDELSLVAPGLAVAGAEVEYRAPIGPGTLVGIASTVGPGLVLVWMSDRTDGSVLVSARVRTVPPGSRPPPPPAA
jgi:acyl-ACP thioesterase